MASGVVLDYLAEVYFQPNNSTRKINDWTKDSILTNNSIMDASTVLMSPREEWSQRPVSAAQLGLVTGLLAVLINSHLPSIKILKTKPRLNEHFLRIFFLVLSALAAPLVAVAFLFLAFYRWFVHVALSLSDPRFAGLLEGTDAIWALEDNASKSIINVLVFLEVEIIGNVYKNLQLLETLRRLMKERVLTSPDSCPKFWQHRLRSRLGYYYWERQLELRVEDYVKYMTDEEENFKLDLTEEDSLGQEHYGISESTLKGLISGLANSPMPMNNAASWEILVGRDPILEELKIDPLRALEEGIPEGTGRFRRYPVLFRVHHSVGDGVALIRLLLETLADNSDQTNLEKETMKTKILGYVNEEPARLTPPKALSRRTSICRNRSVSESSYYINESDSYNVNRPSFLNLENSKRKIKSDFMVSDMCDENLNEREKISMESATKIFYRKFGLPEDYYDDVQVQNEDLGSTVGDCEVGDRRGVYCYSAANTTSTYDDAINSANEIDLNLNEKMYYFDNTEVDGKSEEYQPPLSDKNSQQYRDKSPPPDRCYSPMPPFKRDASRIERIMDKINDSRKTSLPNFSRRNSAPVRKSSVTITLDGCSRRHSIFPTGLHDNLSLIGYDAKTVNRKTSPVPRITRKKYPVMYDDEDSEDSSPTTRRNISRFPRDISHLPHFRKPALNLQDDDSHFPRRHSSTLSHGVSNTRCQYSFLEDDTFPRFPRDNSTSAHQRKADFSSPLRSRTPTPKLHNDGLGLMSSPQFPRCHSSTSSYPIRSQSPFIKDTAPVLSKDGSPARWNKKMEKNFQLCEESTVPRCNLPLVRNNSPLPQNNNLIPSCNSLTMRSNPPTTIDISISSLESQISNSRTELVNHKNQLSPTNNCDNPRSSSHSDCSFTESKEDVKKPMTLFLDGEVLNTNSTTPRRISNLLDSIDHRPSAFQKLCTYVKDKCTLVFALVSLFHQTMVKPAEVNPLHGPDLSGQKVVNWYFDSHLDKSENLLSTIKRIKTRMSDAKFTDVLLSAISSSLETYFLQRGCDRKCIPEFVSVVLPARMMIHKATVCKNKETIKRPSQEESFKIPTMQNKFSVALLSLPLTLISTLTKIVKPFSPIGRLREVSKRTALLRKSFDYHINYWLLHVVSAYLPIPFLAPLSNSAQSTVVLSNLVGPPTQLMLGGYLLKDIVFWVPNLGSTGVGVSVLSYAERLQIGIIADSALLTSQHDVSTILEGIISELKCLDDITAPIKKHTLKV